MAADWGGCEVADEGGIAWCDGQQCPGDGCNATRDVCSGDPARRAICESDADPAWQYCEVVQDGSVRQPWSTWSDLAFVASGLWILWWLGFSVRPGARAAAPNPAATATPISVTYGAVVVFMGPASMLLHASLKSWAGWFDAFSVFTWLFLCAAYTVFAAWGWPSHRRQFFVLIVWGLLATGFAIGGGIDGSFRFIGIVVSGLAWLGAEVTHGIAMAAKNRVRRDWVPWFVMLAFLFCAMTFWVLYNPDIAGPNTCRTLSPFPGHATFHIMAAIATLMAFLCWRTETPDRGAEGGGGRGRK